MKDFDRIARKITIVLFFSQSLSSAGFIAGSTLLADQLSPRERAKTQGFNDLLLNLSSGVSQIGSGIVYAVGGYGIMAVTAAAMAAVPLGLAI